MNEVNDKPEMTTYEASWHEHIAGVREGQKAKAAGADPTAVAAVLAGAAGAREVAGFLLKPVSKGTVMTLRAANALFSEYAIAKGIKDSEREQVELGLAVMVFQDPRELTKRLDAGAIAHLVEAAGDLVFDLPIAQFMALEMFIREQMDVVAKLNGSIDSDSPQPGKKQPGKTGGSSSAKPPNPTTEPTSESSNG